MSGRTLMWVLRSVAFGLFALFLLGKFVLGDRNPLHLIGAIAMGGACVYSAAAAKATSGSKNP